MSSIAERFHKKVVGNQGKDLDYKARITSTGDFERIEQLDTILNSWNNILNIPRGTYDHDPNFGSNLYKYIFDPADKRTISKIKAEIERSLSEYDNRAKIISIDVKFLSNLKGFNISILVEYQNKQATLKTSITENSVINILGG